jgi:hypothetical protein
LTNTDKALFYEVQKFLSPKEFLMSSNLQYIGVSFKMTKNKRIACNYILYKSDTFKILQHVSASAIMKIRRANFAYTEILDDLSTVY